MRTDTGQFTDKRVRQALALTMDRDAMIQALFKGKGLPANDHVIFSVYPYFDESQPQRTRDIDLAKQLLADAGASDLTADLHFATAYLEIADLAVLLQEPGPGGRDHPQSRGRGPRHVLRRPVVPAGRPTRRAPGAAELGIVDYGHRSTPDLFLNSALATKGIWNSSQYSSAEFDAAFGEFQSAVGVDAQKAACTKIQTVLTEDVPIAIPYIYSFLSGNSTAFNGVYSSALGQMFFSSASKA